MRARRSPSLLIVLACGALIAGCGSSGSTDSSSTAATSSTKAPSKSVQAAAASALARAASGGAVGAAKLAQAVAACKTVIHTDPTLSATLKGKIEGICNKAASGNIAGARAAAKEVCLEIINGSPIPAGPDKQQALAACAKE
jgi:hypothetical protein